MPGPLPAQGEGPSLFDAANDATRKDNSPVMDEIDQDVRPQHKLRPLKSYSVILKSECTTRL
jgi:hypothetical protein